MGLILLPRKVRHEILAIGRLRKPEHLDEGTRFIPTSISLHTVFGTETGQYRPDAGATDVVYSGATEAAPLSKASKCRRVGVMLSIGLTSRP